MKFLLLSVLTTVSLLAIDAKVKYDDITIEIDGKEKSYKKGEHFEFTYNQKIRFIKGDGVISYTDKETGISKQLGEDNPYIKIPKPEAVPSKRFILFINVNESVSDGVSVRDEDKAKKISGDFILTKETKEIIIGYNSWGSLPVTLKLFDAKGTERKKLINEHDETSHFTLDRKEVKDDYRVEVTDNSNQILLDIKLVVDKSNK